MRCLLSTVACALQAIAQDLDHRIDSLPTPTKLLHDTASNLDQVHGSTDHSREEASPESSHELFIYYPDTERKETDHVIESREIDREERILDGHMMYDSGEEECGDEWYPEHEPADDLVILDYNWISR